MFCIYLNSAHTQNKVRVSCSISSCLVNEVSSFLNCPLCQALRHLIFVLKCHLIRSCYELREWGFLLDPKEVRRYERG